MLELKKKFRIYNIIFIICFTCVGKVHGAQPLCNSGMCSVIVSNAMQENKPLKKSDFAYLVLKFEQSYVDNSVNENSTNTTDDNSPNSNTDTNTNTNAETSNTNTDNSNMGSNAQLNGVNSGYTIKDEIETVTFLNNEDTLSIPTETSFIEQDFPISNILMEDGEYGDDEAELETTSLFPEEMETETETAMFDDDDTTAIRYNLMKKNVTVVEQRFSQFFVPINEYSVLKLSNVNSMNWAYEYVYVGLVHNKKVYFTQFPLPWGNEKGCVEDRSVTITLEDGNYKSIEWGYTSCRGKVCKYECVHDDLHDPKNRYNRCANQQVSSDNKCNINIYIGWAGTDKNGNMLLDSAQPIYEIKNTL